MLEGLKNALQDNFITQKWGELSPDTQDKVKTGVKIALIAALFFAVLGLAIAADFASFGVATPILAVIACCIVPVSVHLMLHEILPLDQFFKDVKEALF